MVANKFRANEANNLDRFRCGLVVNFARLEKQTHDVSPDTIRSYGEHLLSGARRVPGSFLAVPNRPVPHRQNTTLLYLAGT